jgi:hypothetical protein
MVPFDPRLGRGFVVFWFNPEVAELPVLDAVAPELMSPEVEPAVPDVDPIEPVGTLADGAASPYAAGGLLVPLIPSVPTAGATD